MITAQENFKTVESILKKKKENRFIIVVKKLQRKILKGINQYKQEKYTNNIVKSKYNIGIYWKKRAALRCHSKFIAVF